MSKKGHITSVGGQALIEGVMMQGPKGVATAVRKPDNSICVEYHDVKHAKDKCKLLGLPIIRGIVAFIESMILGYKLLMYSADVSGMEDIESDDMNKFEKWLDEKLGDKFMDIIMGIATILGFALAFFIFFFLPVFLFNKLNAACNLSLTPWQGTIEGLMKIFIFIVYMALVSQMKDIKRLFMYHGAEHKSIACYEAGEELTVENVKKCTRFHPRCGTSFMFVMLILSILVVTLLSLAVPAELKQNTVAWMLIKLPLIPIIMGFGYEFIKYAGRHNNLFVKILSAPGLWMQRITTKEPDDDIIEVGIESIKAVITGNIEDDEIK
ncbi:DUF1385 domain-containing protein [uncultured Eubacterium sp.]|uniref:DUF1385 domain-containing protein n=1 Tax=uncultured Eubacterium sp. TaxID=165185 RepID=UPI0028054C3A|nr:DUF1385 domain-containing protein [uncultured Eubacterium sp.]